MKMMMKSQMLLVMMFASVTMIAQKGGDDDLVKHIQVMNNQMVGAILNNDYGKLLTYYDDKVLSMPNYGKMVRGIDEFKAKHQESAEKGNKVTAMKLNTKKVSVHGDVAIEIGSFTITMELAGMPDPVSDAGKYMTVWRKNGNTYKILYEMWNTNTHPMEAMKKGESKGEAPKGKKGGKLQNDGGKTKSGKKPASTEKEEI